MILLPEGLEDLWHLSRLPDRLHRSDLPVPAAPFHPEDLLRLLHRPDLPGPEDQRRLSHRSDLQDPEDLPRLSLPEDPEDLPRLSLPEDPEDLLHPSDLQAR